MNAHPIPDDVLIDHLAVLGKTGSGKTFAAKGIVERLLARNLRVCIVDPKNAWHGLRSSADGKTAAFPIVIFGGPKADVPLLAAHGKVLGEAVATGHLSCIICTKGMPEGERIRFLTDFFQTLDMKNTQPLHLVLDEAHMMAPQKPLGEMQRLTHWTSELVSGGRGTGFRILLLSQRPARLNKDVLTQCESLVAMRMTGPQDRDAVRAWIADQADVDKGKEIVASLPSLQNGEGWFWAPAKDILKRVKFPLITTYDNSRTAKDAKADDRAILAPVDLAALEAKLGRAKTEIDANDPKALKAKVTELEKVLAAKPAKAPGISAEDAAALRSEGYAAGIKAAKDKLAFYFKNLAANLAKIQSAVEPIAEYVTDMPRDLDTLLGEAGLVKRILTPTRLPAPTRVWPTEVPESRPIPKSIGGLDGPQTRIMGSLGIWKSMGFEHPTKPQVAVIANYSAESPSFRNALGALQTAGLIEHGDGRARLTASGATHESVGTIAFTDQRDLQAFILRRLDGPQTKIFNALLYLAPNGEEVSRPDLAAESKYEPGSPSFRNSLGALRTMEVVDYGKGTVFLRRWVFLEQA